MSAFDPLQTLAECPLSTHCGHRHARYSYSVDHAPNYWTDGYAKVEALIPPEICAAFLERLKVDLGPRPVNLSGVTQFPNLLARPAFEVYGQHYIPMAFFLWGLTPTVSRLLGRDLLPTYDYLRIYREGDVCRVHSDRYSCEHSLSLTLGYSDGRSWDLQVEPDRTDPSAKVDESFPAKFASVTMKPGDGVLYQGVHHRHGRTEPNPNRWSAHLFLHWVDRNGPYRKHAFDGQIPAAVDFQFA